MKLSAIMTLAFLGLFALSQATFASGSHSGDHHAKPEKTMAKILFHLNHFPGGDEKMKLTSIINESSSAHEKIIANAILNLQHSASSSDKKQLKTVINDSGASDNLKKLANVVFNLNHKPSSADKNLLAGIMD